MCHCTVLVACVSLLPVMSSCRRRCTVLVACISLLPVMSSCRRRCTVLVACISLLHVMSSCRRRWFVVCIRSAWSWRRQSTVSSTYQRCLDPWYTSQVEILLHVQDISTASSFALRLLWQLCWYVKYSHDHCVSMWKTRMTTVSVCETLGGMWNTHMASTSSLLYVNQPLVCMHTMLSRVTDSFTVMDLWTLWNYLATDDATNERWRISWNSLVDWSVCGPPSWLNTRSPMTNDIHILYSRHNSWSAARSTFLEKTLPCLLSFLAASEYFAHAKSYLEILWTTCTQCFV